MIFPASEREQSVFTYWLDKHMIRKGVTAMAFMRLCDNGKVPGFAPDDWPVQGDATAPGPVQGLDWLPGHPEPVGQPER